MAVAFTLLILLVPETGLAASAPLKVGDKGWKVKVAQQKLNVVGINTEVTGNFSKNTEKALKDFQLKYKLKVTGLLDDGTYQLLRRKVSVVSAVRKLSLQQRNTKEFPINLAARHRKLLIVRAMSNMFLLSIKPTCRDWQMHNVWKVFLY
jgi:peptidoglycan hydrolase-like protein with peptidoglycan-binding domain